MQVHRRMRFPTNRPKFRYPLRYADLSNALLDCPPNNTCTSFICQYCSPQFWSVCFQGVPILIKGLRRVIYFNQFCDETMRDFWQWIVWVNFIHVNPTATVHNETCGRHLIMIWVDMNGISFCGRLYSERVWPMLFLICNRSHVVDVYDICVQTQAWTKLTDTVYNEEFHEFSPWYFRGFVYKPYARIDRGCI